MRLLSPLPRYSPNGLLIGLCLAFIVITLTILLIGTFSVVLESPACTPSYLVDFLFGEFSKIGLSLIHSFSISRFSMGSSLVGTGSWTFGMIPFLELLRDLMLMHASKCGLAVFRNVLAFNSQFWPYAARLQDCILRSFRLGKNSTRTIRMIVTLRWL